MASYCLRMRWSRSSLLAVIKGFGTPDEDTCREKIRRRTTQPGVLTRIASKQAGTKVERARIINLF